MSDAEPSALCMQVTHTYSVALDRSDHCLLMYGFVDDSPAEPLLAAVDHIGGIIMEDEDDSMYGGAPFQVFKAFTCSARSQVGVEHLSQSGCCTC